MSERRYFWLKLPTGFFKRHDIKILEAMDNGKDYLLFYMKLMLESLDHEGRLRFSDAIPYDHKMLSIVTDTNIDIVKNAMEVLERMQLITIMDDETIYIQAVEKMIGSESAAAERQRRSRDNRRALLEAKCDNVTACHNLSQNGHREIDIELEKEIEIDKEKEILSNESIKKENAESSLSDTSEAAPEEPKKKKRFIPPTIEEVREYCRERNKGVNPDKWYDFYLSKNFMIGKSKMQDWKAAVRTWEHDQKPKNSRGSGPGNEFDELARQEGYIGEDETLMPFGGT